MSEMTQRINEIDDKTERYIEALRSENLMLKDELQEIRENVESLENPKKVTY